MGRSRDLAKRFLELHRKGEPLLLANVWDAGSARLLESLDYCALATTSSGHAGTLGRLDGGVTRDVVLGHCREIVAATRLPVSADLENGFAEDAEGVAEAVRLAGETGLAGCSIEDYSGGASARIYPLDEAVARVRAAVTAAHANLILTARAENHIRGVDDLGDTIERLQAYEEAGADVVYAPGLADLGEIRRIVEAVDVPVNVLCRPGGPMVSELASVGVARISVGGGFYFAALGALASAAREWRERGTHEFWKEASVGRQAGQQAFD
ncbi:MAG: isocitrate lyase/phosphoenolpyruvate mutase family protein [Deltaproteobacteria bacterium]|nr:isocitrate lyase/phosphoenolpyruvate mutase family protein [Deltaproteobacteria bacterium]MBW2363285.1 isocitrate lyase/phosphoenolpyruvate mutase family protein [Deltaproteobacteria bacterium]